MTALRLRRIESRPSSNLGRSRQRNASAQSNGATWRCCCVRRRARRKVTRREFTRLGIPLTVARGGFYESMEITDLLSLLQLLDNPLQDLPALAVLHSPLVGMSLDELAAIRLLLPKGHCWTALQRFHETSHEHPGWAKADRFLKNFRGVAATGAASFALALPGSRAGRNALRGVAADATARRTASCQCPAPALARATVRPISTAGIVPVSALHRSAAGGGNRTDCRGGLGRKFRRLMSIHQSKGLEFPVVVVADLGKPFNLSGPARGNYSWTRSIGLCPQIKPPHTGQRYPSLPYWLARQRQKQESLGEELRLLYVAMTRARDTLILTGTLSEKKFLRQWRETADLTTRLAAGGANYLDWIAAWCLQNAGKHFRFRMAKTPGCAGRSMTIWTNGCSMKKWRQAEIVPSNGITAPLRRGIMAKTPQTGSRGIIRISAPRMNQRRLQLPPCVATIRPRDAETEAAFKFQVQSCKFKVSKSDRSGKLSASGGRHGASYFFATVFAGTGGDVGGVEGGGAAAGVGGGLDPRRRAAGSGFRRAVGVLAIGPGEKNPRDKPSMCGANWHSPRAFRRRNLTARPTAGII